MTGCSTTKYEREMRGLTAETPMSNNYLTDYSGTAECISNPCACCLLSLPPGRYFLLPLSSHQYFYNHNVPELSHMRYAVTWLLTWCPVLVLGNVGQRAHTYVSGRGGTLGNYLGTYLGNKIAVGRLV